MAAEPQAIDDICIARVRSRRIAKAGLNVATDTCRCHNALLANCHRNMSFQNPVIAPESHLPRVTHDRILLPRGSTIPPVVNGAYASLQHSSHTNAREAASATRLAENCMSFVCDIGGGGKRAVVTPWRSAAGLVSPGADVGYTRR